MIRAEQVPVLVVGAGPAGLTATLLLARHGIPVLCVDRRNEVSPLPRARGVHARAVEILRVLGVEPDMRAHALDIDPGAEWRPDLASPPAASHVTGGPTLTEVSPCEGVAIAQDVFETVLRQHVASADNATLQLGCEVQTLAPAAEGVDVSLLEHTSGQRATVHAQYVIGADGWRSATRDTLGIKVRGPADLGSHRAITFRADLTPWTGSRPRGIYFLTGSAAALFWTHPDHRWAIHVPDPARTEDPEDAQYLLRRALRIEPEHTEVLTDSRWTAAAQNAACFAQGRVFLIGDAAHRVPPAGATGVSSAMADAHNLGWKLAAVLHGHARPTLLSTYATEREAVARTTTEDARAAWLAMSQPGTIPFTGRTLRQLDMGYLYQSNAVLAEASAVPAEEVDYVPDGRPGGRAPHLWLTEGRQRSTIDLFDKTFVLLTGPAGGAWLAASESVRRICRVPIVAETVRTPDWPDVYGVASSGAVLVRPDGHIAWRRQDTGTPTTPDGQLRRDLNRALALITGNAQEHD